MNSNCTWAPPQYGNHYILISTHTPPINNTLSHAHTPFSVFYLFFISSLMSIYYILADVELHVRVHVGRIMRNQLYEQPYRQADQMNVLLCLQFICSCLHFLIIMTVHLAYITVCLTAPGTRHLLHNLCSIQFTFIIRVHHANRH